MLSWLLSASLALAAPDCTPVDLPAWIAAVREKGNETAYLCLATHDDADEALLAALASESSEAEGGHKRVQRALALHVMERLHAPADLEALRAINAADRRLLRDAVQARRGRASPIEQHAAVFQKFDWYAPRSNYSVRDLTELDHANLQIIDKPPKKPRPVKEQAPAADAMPTAPAAPAAASSAESSPICGTAGGARSGGWMWLLGAATVLMGRRRMR